MEFLVFCPGKGRRIFQEPFQEVPFQSWSFSGIGQVVYSWCRFRTKIQGIWGKFVDADGNDATNEGNGNKYWVANEQVMFNLSNLLYGYNENRVWNLIPFAGAGIGRSMTHNAYALDYSVGIQSSWKIGKKTNLFAEVGVNSFDADIDGCAGNSRNTFTRRCNNFYAEVGLTFKLGRGTWDKTPDVDAITALHQSELDALNATLEDANAENERLRNGLENQKTAETQVVKQFVGTPVSVFFNLGKSKIASRKDLVNVETLAKYAKENNLKLVVNGYADSATGSAAFNEKLSLARAERVAGLLVKMGVDKDNIIVKSNGGVKDLAPVSYNRRATIQISE